jgi:Transcriptional regulator, AbiEi antitoxin, Type IV TA system
MLRESDILREIPGLLADLTGVVPETVGVDPPKGADLLVRLGEHLLVIDVKTSARAGVLSEAAHRVAQTARELSPKAIAILAVPFMGEVGRRICEQAGVGFVDLSGNASIKAPPLIIRVDGRPNRFIRRGRPASVFAPTSSRIIRLMLLDPTRWWKQHELAREGSLGAGYVSRICKRLEVERFIDRNADRGVRPRDAALLLEAWRHSYDFGAHEVQQGHVSARSGEELAERVLLLLEQRGIRHALTGLAAAWKLAPFAAYRLVTVFVDGGPDKELLDALKWKSGEPGANLWLVRPNDEGVFHGSNVVDGCACVAPIQAFIDLRGQPERSDEAAAQLRREKLPWA